MAVDDSFKRPGAVPFKWELQPGVPKTKPPQNNSTSQKLRPPPSGISFYPPQHSTLLIRVTTRSKSFDHRHRRRLSRPPNSPRNSVAVDTSCFPMPSPSRKVEKKMTHRLEDIKTEDIDDIDTHDLQTLARWSLSPRKSFSPFCSSSPLASPFRMPPRAPREDPEWAAYGLF